MNLNDVGKGTYVEITYALGCEIVTLKKTSKNNNISKKVLKNSSLRNKTLPNIVVEINEEDYVPFGQVTIAMLEIHNGPEIYIWNKISGEVIHYNNKLYLIIFSQKEAITKNLRKAVRFEKTGFGTITKNNTESKVILKDLSTTGLGIYVLSPENFNVDDVIDFEIDIKNDREIKKGQAKIVRKVQENNRIFMGVQIL